jgi:UPF0716 family protein affecting phage T7 exclusion
MDLQNKDVAKTNNSVGRLITYMVGILFSMLGLYMIIKKPVIMNKKRRSIASRETTGEASPVITGIIFLIAGIITLLLAYYSEKIQIVY